MKRRLLPALATTTLLLAGCATTPASEPVGPEEMPDASMPSWRVGDVGTLRRVIISRAGGDPLECVVYTDHWRQGLAGAGGLSCDWEGTNG